MRMEEEEGIEKLSMDLRKIAIIATRIAPSTLGLSQDAESIVHRGTTKARFRFMLRVCCALYVHHASMIPMLRQFQVTLARWICDCLRDHEQSCVFALPPLPQLLQLHYCNHCHHCYSSHHCIYCNHCNHCKHCEQIRRSIEQLSKVSGDLRAH